MGRSMLAFLFLPGASAILTGKSKSPEVHQQGMSMASSLHSHWDGDIQDTWCDTGVFSVSAAAQSFYNVEWECDKKGTKRIEFDCGHHCIGDGLIKDRGLCERNNCLWTHDNDKATRGEDSCFCRPQTCIAVGGTITNRRCHWTRSDESKKGSWWIQETPMQHMPNGNFHCADGWVQWKTFDLSSAKKTIHGPLTAHDCMLAAFNQARPGQDMYIEFDWVHNDCNFEAGGNRKYQAIRHPHHQLPDFHWACRLVNGTSSLKANTDALNGDLEAWLGHSQLTKISMEEIMMDLKAPGGFYPPPDKYNGPYPQPAPAPSPIPDSSPEDIVGGWSVR